MLRRTTTLALGVEAQEGVAEPIGDLTVLPVVASPTLTPEYGTAERQQATPDLTPRIGGESFKSGQLQFSMELQAAAGGAGVAPPFAIPLQACGMRQFGGGAPNSLTTKRLAIGTVTTGPVPVLSTFTQATSNVKGVVLQHTVNGDSHSFIALAPNTDPADLTTDDLNVTTPTGGSATIAITTVVGDAIAWVPWATGLSSILLDGVTGGIIPDGVAIEQDQGGGVIARGRTSHLWNILNPVAPITSVPLTFVTYEGSPVFDDSVDIDLTDFPATDGQVLSGATQVQRVAPSLTGRMNFGGVEVGLKGLRGSCLLRIRNGELPIWDFDMQGAALVPGDVNPNDVPALGVVPPPTIGSSLLVGTYSNPKWSEVQWNWNMDVSLRECPDDPSGYISAIIGARGPQITMDPELVQEVIFNQFGLAYNKTAFRIVQTLGDGSGDGNTFELHAWQAQMASISPGERAGNTTGDYTINATGVGNDEACLYAY